MKLGEFNGWTLNHRFRKALSEMAAEQGVECEPSFRKDPQFPHLLFPHLEHLSVFSNTVCALNKLQFGARLRNAEAYASLDRTGRTVPVIWHQRREEEPTATMLAEDAFWLLGLAEKALAMEEAERLEAAHDA